MSEEQKTSIAVILIVFVLTSVVFLIGKHAFLENFSSNAENNLNKIIAHQCFNAFKTDFPEYKNVICENINADDGCFCRTWDYEGGWEKENTKYKGKVINIKTHYFNLK